MKCSLQVFSTRRKLGHGVAFYKILTLGAHSIAKSAICQAKNTLVALPLLLKLSVKFQWNRLPNVKCIHEHLVTRGLKAVVNAVKQPTNRTLRMNPPKFAEKGN